MSVRPFHRERPGNARDQLRDELALLDLRLERHVLRLRAAQLLNETDFRGLYIADEQVDAILRSSGKRGDDDATVAALTTRIDAQRADLAARVAAPPFARLQQELALDRFALELLVVAVAVEIDLRYQTLFAYAQNDVTRKLPSVDLALQLLCDSDDERVDRRDALRHDAPLVRERLLQLGDDPQDRDAPWLARPLRADARVAEFLLGGDALDARLAPCTNRILPKRTLRDLHIDGALRERIDRVLARVARTASTVVINGPPGSGRATLAQAMAAQLGLSLLIFDVAELPPSLPFADAVALLRREALLTGDAIVVAGFDRLLGDDPAQRTRIAQELLVFPRPLFLLTTDSWAIEPSFRRAPLFEIDVGLPSANDRLALWSDALGDDAAADDVADIASRYLLTPRQIEGAAAHARAIAPQRMLALADLEAGAQAQSSRGLRKLASRVETKQDWSDLVLPSRQMQQLRDVCTAVRYRRVVFDEWGFGRRLAGSGIAVLFCGASGTGKTMAATIVARKLGLEMFRVDLSAVVSKYIGETEKNLSRIFAEAQSSNAILFFDEADALFGKRSEVKDAHDRYANIEIAFLLQRIESYDGIVVMATNLSRNIDEAFARRMFETIEFPFPDPPHRERIWRGLLARGVPVADEIDHEFLARQFELSGGNIRNIVLASAFAAASSTSAVTMRDLVIATARELLKVGRLPSKGEFREYYEWIREAGA